MTDFVIGSGTVQANGAVAPWDTHQPGDRLIIESRTDALAIRNFVGTEAEPIIVINDSGTQVVITETGVQQDLQIRDNQWMTVTGTGDSAYTYGFWFTTGTWSIRVTDGSEGVRCQNFQSSDSEQAAVSCYSTVAQGFGPGDEHEPFTFTLFLIERSGREGFYIGESSGSGPFTSTVTVSSGTIIDAGWDAVQGKRGNDYLFQNLTIIRPAQDTESGQMSAARFGNYTGPAVMDTVWVQDSAGNGIVFNPAFSGYGPISCYNCTVLRSAVHNFLVQDASDATITVSYCTSVDAGADGMHSNTASADVTFRDSISVGSLTSDVDASGCTVSNMETGTVASQFFADYDTDDLRPTASSPGVDAGVGSAPANDATGKARDASPDIGAFEYFPPVAARLVVGARVPVGTRMVMG